MHPDALLASLLQTAKRENHRAILQGLHKVCRVQFETNRDFSFRTIGKLCEAGGLFKARIIYNAASANHRALVTAWDAFAKENASNHVPPHVDATPPDQDPHVSKIPDLALRAYFQTRLAELKRARAELNLLKSQTSIVLHLTQNRRLPSQPNGRTPELQLLPSELDALAHALSSEVLSRAELTEGPSGELVNAAGRSVFAAGYCFAIRKVLRHFSHESER